jgi:glycosyltransferase
MKVSIITACLNNGDLLESTILSILSQNYSHIEYLIIDGGSTDNTPDILKKYKDKINFIISEKDDGMYDAINKGLKKATGEIIGILNADDFYSDNTVISKVAKAFTKSGAEAVYGDLQYVKRTDVNRVVRNWKSGEYKQGMFLKGWMPPHPAFFLKKECYERFGGFNTTLKIAADYELMLRMLHKNKICAHYIPEVLVKMRTGGASNKTVKNNIKKNLEDREAWRINGLTPGKLTLYFKPLQKVKQFF